MTPESPIPPDPGKGGGAAEARATKPIIPDYALIRQIGQGSYGDVWLARGLTGVYRAIKVVWRDRFGSAEPFEREFKGLQKFSTMTLPEASQMALLHVGQNEAAGFFYYVMELADDVETGREVDPAKYAPLTVKEVRARRGRLPAAECVAFGVGLARALAGLHERGLVHRDIKPSNIILVGGVPKLADIGLVAETSDALTYVGTAGFVPPEGPGKPSADVFALGKLLYELATGIDREDYPRLPPELDKMPDRKLILELNEIILRCCEPVPERRYHDASAILADLLVLEADGSARRRRGWRLLLAAALLAAAGGLVATGYYGWRSRSPAAPESDVTSIAVLPFKNLSTEPADAYLADGVHQDVLSRLGLISDLRVISRPTMLAYRAAQKPADQIGRELNVAFLGEGSVRREGARIRVTCNLRDVRTDQPVLSKTYERDFTELFAIQAELAQAVADALSAKMRPETNTWFERRPTENLAAYEQYVKGLAVRESGLGWRKTLEAEPFLQKAVELDPTFALAWAQLAAVESEFIFQCMDLKPDRFAKADAAIGQAMRLAPESPLVLRALAVYTYYRHHDYARAAVQFTRLLADQPNDASLHNGLGVVLRRQNRWVESLPHLRRSVELEPVSVGASDALLMSLKAGRRWSEAIAERRRSAAYRGVGPAAQIELLNLLFLATGSRDETIRFLAQCTPAQLEEPALLDFRRKLALERGDRAEFKRLDRLLQERSPADHGEIRGALDYCALGEIETGRAGLAGPVKDLRMWLESDPANPAWWSDLGLAEAMLGNKEEAIRCGRKAVEMMPESLDPNLGTLGSKWLAASYAWIGEKDVAIAELRRLLPMPWANLSANSLRHDPLFAPLRGDPRFEALVADPKNNNPLF